MKRIDTKSLVIGIFIGLVIFSLGVTGAVLDRIFTFQFLDKIIPRQIQEKGLNLGVDQKILNEESVVIDVAEKASPSVVTVSIKTPQQKVLEFSPFFGFRQGVRGGQEQDIGTGFIVSSDGLIVTNKHVVSDTRSTYKVITKDNKEYEVKEISRDPSNDLAVLKINPSDHPEIKLQALELGDSSNLKVGQFVIAIGTALGEFRHTVTTGVISGLGRGIVAGSVYEGYVERLDNVIQTDAAINPGNSGGPLLNSAGQVIGVNVAVAQGAQNIGFAIPVNVIKDSLGKFKETGKFPSKPFLGVRYQIIGKQTALMNNVPQGAYVLEVVSGSPAEEAGIKVDDIITKIDDKKLDSDNALADIVASKKPGDRVNVVVWRDDQELNLTVTLGEAE
jgi:2-alkenal reductase